MKQKFNSLKELQLYVFKDFRRFLVYALDYLGLDCGEHHLDFSDALLSGEREVVILQPRGAGKSTEGALYCLFRAARRPNMRIRVLSSNQVHSSKLADLIIEYANEIPACRFLMPKKITSKQKWNWAPCNTIDKDYCIECSGVDGKVNTGSHCDLLWADDIEAEDIQLSPLQRLKVKQSFAKMIPIINRPKIRYPEGKQNQDMVELLVTGTPWYVDSVYKVPKDTNVSHVLRGAKYCVTPALNEDGSSFWESELSSSELERIKRLLPPRDFALWYQMDMEYVSTQDSLVNLDIVKQYSKELYKYYPDEEPYSPTRRDPVVHVPYAFIDPSKGGDEWALCIAGIVNGKIHILDSAGWFEPTDRAAIKAIEYFKKYHVKTIYIEGNFSGIRGEPGYENILANILREHNLYITVEKKNVTGEKDHRISAFLVTALNSGQAVLHPRLLESENNATLDQMLRFTDQGTEVMKNDDRIDSMSLAVQILSQGLYKAPLQDPIYRSRFSK